jgi:hypothetical protein
MDFEAVCRTVEDVTEALLELGQGGGLFSPNVWPHGSCEHVAVVVAAVLEDRGFGQWTFVQARVPGEIGGHSWLEWPDFNGVVLFSIDPTLHQFREWREPFVRPGQTPAAATFTEIRWQGVVWDWRYLGSDQKPFRMLIKAVRQKLARARECQASPGT